LSLRAFWLRPLSFVFLLFCFVFSFFLRLSSLSLFWDLFPLSFLGGGPSLSFFLTLWRGRGVNCCRDRLYPLLARPSSRSSSYWGTSSRSSCFFLLSPLLVLLAIEGLLLGLLAMGGGGGPLLLLWLRFLLAIGVTSSLAALLLDIGGLVLVVTLVGSLAKGGT
jgi:hypothetical protein